LNLDSKIRKTVRILTLLLIVITITSLIIVLLNNGFENLTDWLMIFLSGISAYIIWETLNKSIEFQKETQANFNKEQARTKKESFFNYLDKERSYLTLALKEIKYGKQDNTNNKSSTGISAIIQFNNDCASMFGNYTKSDLIRRKDFETGLKIGEVLTHTKTFLKDKDYHIILNSLERVCEYTKVADINYLNYYQDRDIIMFIDSIYFIRHIIEMLQNLIKIQTISNEEDSLQEKINLKKGLETYSHLQ